MLPIIGKRYLVPTGEDQIGNVCGTLVDIGHHGVLATLLDASGDKHTVHVGSLQRVPMPSEVWVTKTGRIVLVVAHNIADQPGDYGLVWLDENDGQLGFMPTTDLLLRPTLLDVRDWGIATARGIQALEQSKLEQSKLEQSVHKLGRPSKRAVKKKRS